MSTSAKLLKLSLRGNDDAEMYVIDGALETVGYGVREVSLSLPPGLYKVRAVRGGTRRERLVELTDKPLQVDLWVHEFDAVAPIMPVFHRHYTQIERHAQRAIKAAGRKAIAGGAASCRLLLLGHMSADQGSGDPLARMRLFPWRQASGRRTIDCDIPAEHIGDQIWRGWFRACAPGCHVLELHDGVQWVRQAVLVAPGWETRIFVRRAAGTSPDISIQMAEPGRPVVYNDHYQTVEVARRALETNRPIIVGDYLVNDLLHGKFDNPIMGMTGLHLFLEALERRDLPEEASPRRVDLSGQFVNEGRDVVRDVIANLHKLLRGGGTDWRNASPNDLTEPVPADLAGLENRAARFLDPTGEQPPRIDHPPMFWASWAALRDAPAEGARYAVQQELWTKTAHSIAAGPYFSWQPNRVSLSAYVDSAIESAAPTAIMSTMATPLVLSPGFGSSTILIGGGLAATGVLRGLGSTRTHGAGAGSVEVKSVRSSRRRAAREPAQNYVGIIRTVPSSSIKGGAGTAPAAFEPAPPPDSSLSLDLGETRASVGRALGIPESLIKLI